MANSLGEKMWMPNSILRTMLHTVWASAVVWLIEWVVNKVGNIIDVASEAMFWPVVGFIWKSAWLIYTASWIVWEKWFWKWTEKSAWRYFFSCLTLWWLWVASFPSAASIWIAAGTLTIAINLPKVINNSVSSFWGLLKSVLKSPFTWIKYMWKTLWVVS